MRDFLEDLREHWDDGYWWADRQLLLAVLVGIVSLAFELIKLYARHKWELED